MRLLNSLSYSVASITSSVLTQNSADCDDSCDLRFFQAFSKSGATPMFWHSFPHLYRNDDILFRTCVHVNNI